MKTRNGFVSNSSSSSFLVVRSTWDKVNLIAKEEEKLLKRFGFKKVNCFCSDQVDFDFYSNDHEGVDPKDYNLGYSVDCNQDDVIYFLLKNNISFEATCHYGDYTVIYKKGQKDFLIAQNYGSQLKGYYRKESYKDMMANIKFNKPLEYVNVKRWLKREEKWNKDILIRE